MTRCRRWAEVHVETGRCGEYWKNAEVADCGRRRQQRCTGEKKNETGRVGTGAAGTINRVVQGK
ncbi:MAG: hypothetical protein ACK56I_34555, partial [bacterium]